MQRTKAAEGREAVKAVSAKREDPRPGSVDAAARMRVAVETYAHNEAALRRIARRYSLCVDDAEDALQRGLEILLRKPPSDDPRELVKWTQTVVKHEALAIRRERERILAGPAAAARADWVSHLPASGDGPPERAERRETVARTREALQALKPQELRALTLLAEGYSYAEIGEITSWSMTKINRCIAEGRERFRRVVSRSADGSRCEEMQLLISAFCDGEAGADDAATVREHLRVCAHCRATVRAYRAAPPAVAALAPLLPLRRSLLERAHDALGELAARFGGGKADAASQVASGSGATGAAAVAKIAALCVATAGGAAACVTTGLVPAPLDLRGSQSPPAALERRAQPVAPSTAAVEYEPQPLPEAPAMERPDPKPKKTKEATEAEAPAAAEAVPDPAEPAAASGAVEYAPPPEPEPAPEPATAEGSTSGSPAGEFGP